MDVCITVPKSFTHPASPGKIGLAAWIGEGDPPGSEWSGTEWAYTTSGVPKIEPGERVYVVCNGRLVGYAPLIRVEQYPVDGQRSRSRLVQGGTRKRTALIRGGGAVACTINEPIAGFMGFRYRWWNREDEKPLDLAALLGTQKETASSRLATALPAV
jgi:hypothetical protein